MGHSTGPTPVQSHQAAITPAAALQNQSLGLGFSGGAFLIFYFTGVVAVLKELGVIKDTTKIAGSSSGAINAASTCSGLTHQQMWAANLALANACRDKNACRGFLGRAARQQVETVLPKDAAQRCKGRLFVAVTQANAGDAPDPGVLLSGFNTTAQMVDALGGSAWLPYFSGPSPVVFAGKQALYDGGFTIRLPCPPEVAYCVRVWHLAPTPELNVVSEPPATVTKKENATNYGFLGMLQGIGYNEKDTAGNAYLPLNPVMQQFPGNVDIYPGLSGPMKIPAEKWNKLGLDVPDAATLVQVYDQGRRDAAAWAGKQKGLTTQAAIDKALAATVVRP